MNALRRHAPARFLWIGAVVATLLFDAATSRGATIWTGSGTNPETGGTAVSASATFTITGNILTIVLQNTSGPTLRQGDALTGIEFNITGAAPLLALVPLNPIALTAGSSIFTTTSASNTTDPLDGSWTDDITSGSFDYGVATSGLSGEFNGGSITRGNSSPNYGIVSGGTTFSPFGGSRFPFIRDSLTFTFDGALGLSESQISQVDFFFGTDGTGRVHGSPGTLSPVPVPGTLVLAFSGLASFGISSLGFRRRKVSI